MYKALKEKGVLLEHCHKREQELKQLAIRIDKQLRKSNPKPNTDSFIIAVQYENRITIMVREFIIDNLS